MALNITDWKFRSWKHNYWKIVNNAEKKKQQIFEGLSISDREGWATEDE